MADRHSVETRSYIMSQIKGKNTKPEILVRKLLHSEGFRFRIHVKNLPGTPDIVLPKYKTVIMVHGCFWHGHNGCPGFKIPKTKTEWWKNKIARTKNRDLRNEEKLFQLEWKVITIYECQLKKMVLESSMKKLFRQIRNGDHLDLRISPSVQIK